MKIPDLESDSMPLVEVNELHAGHAFGELALQAGYIHLLY
jgi:hypothetical protein